MNKVEIEERIKYYIKHETTEAIPYCQDCSSLADLHDPYDGNDYCKTCLNKSLSSDLDFLKNHTVYSELK